ncbi:hypothetical protein lbkm_0345 [Lachnospiraceae bacterium KM106-2]|nr:hypothetical protein lbkm_0345 [Lachnospiraceae bacterium KM106-2]
MKRSKVNRFLAVLLSFIMLFMTLIGDDRFSMTASADESEPEKVVETEGITTGQYVIYNPEYKMALSSTKSTGNSNYNAGVSMSLNESGSFDSVERTEVWTVTKSDTGYTIADQDGKKLSMDVSYSSTPFDKENDKWELSDVGNGMYNVKNIGRTSYLEWYSSKNYYSAYTKIASGSEGMFAMQFVPVKEEAIATAKPDATATPAVSEKLEDGRYFIYSDKATGVMAYSIIGGCASYISATPDKDTKKVSFSEGDGKGAAVYTFKKQEDGSYLIQCGSKFLAANSSEELYLADEKIDSETACTYWNVENNSELGGYTIASKTVTYNKNKVYMEYYSSKGFCLYTAKSLSAIYSFHFYDATDVKDDDGYVGTKPASAALPDVGSKYVIYCGTGSGVMGAEVAGVDGAESSMGLVAASLDKEGKLSVQNGGLIFTVGKTSDGYYTFENNGKYLASNNEEELFVQKDCDEYAEWSLINASTGFLMKNKKAAWSSSSGSKYPVYVEYFSGGFAGYSFKATTADIFTMNFFPYEDTYETGYVVNPKVLFSTSADANLGVDYEMEFTLDDLGKIQKTDVNVSFEDSTQKNYKATMDGYSGKVTIPAEDLKGHTSMKIKVDVESNETDTNKAAYSGEKTVPINDEPMILKVSPAANAQTGSNVRPEISVKYANIGTKAEVKMTINEEVVIPVQKESEHLYCYTSTADMTKGKQVINVTITREDGKKVTKKWAFTIGSEGVQPYFGQIHSHTAEYSDGSGTLEDAYDYAMNKAADTDYMIVTDHSNYFDTTSSATTDSIYDDGASSILASKTVDDNGKTLNLWQEAKQTASHYNSLSSKFVAAYGYEMTWSGGPGHINVFNSKGIVSRNNNTLNNKTNNAGMFTFYDLLVDANGKGVTSSGQGAISAQFNHPGTTFGYFDSFTGWTKERDDVMNLIEVGNGDGAIGSTAYFPSYEYYDMCLSAGWHVAPTNGQDNHKGSWGDANTARTVMLANSFNEDGLYEAMGDRHVYSTEDQNLSILYYLDDTLQGGIIDGYDKDKVKVSVSLADKDSEKLGHVYVIGENGKVLYTSDTLDSNTADLDITLDNTSAYYYVKVIEKDGDIAVTAPVWVDDVNSGKANVKASLHNASEDTDSKPVVGKEEALTTILTNHEDSNIVLNGYSITIDGKSVASESDLSNEIAANGTRNYTYNWKPESNGTHEVVASFVVTVNGEAQTITATKSIYVAGKDYETVSSIAAAKAGSENQEFTVEGIVTTNSSGYDKNTAFFDCIYIQDGTAGINIFPVSGNFKIGQKVRAHGAVTYYNGEIELNLSEKYGGYIEVIDSTVNERKPTAVTCKEAMADHNIGNLMQVTGTVKKTHETSGVIDRIYVEDGSGEAACIYINGYILNSIKNDTNFGKDGTKIQSGDYITVTGIGSIDVDELGEVDYLHRLRVRDRAEVMITEKPVIPTITPTTPSTTPSTTPPTTALTGTPTPAPTPTMAPTVTPSVTPPQVTQKTARVSVKKKSVSVAPNGKVTVSYQASGKVKVKASKNLTASVNSSKKKITIKAKSSAVMGTKGTVKLQCGKKTATVKVTILKTANVKKGKTSNYVVAHSKVNAKTKKKAVKLSYNKKIAKVTIQKTAAKTIRFKVIGLKKGTTTITCSVNNKKVKVKIMVKK